jgi:uncharacterized damage-inducible protein DinB
MRTSRIAILSIVVAAVIASPPLSVQAQSSQPAVISSLIRDIDQLEQKLVSLAEAMPPAAMEWRPAAGVRSMNEVLMHIAADNYFLPTAAGVDAPAETGIRAGDYASVQAYESRTVPTADAIATMRASFEHLRAAMRRTDDAFLARQLNLFGMEMTGMDLWVLTTTHLHEHLGQNIAYARSNNVVPPWSRQD